MPVLRRAGAVVPSEEGGLRLRIQIGPASPPVDGDNPTTPLGPGASAPGPFGTRFDDSDTHPETLLSSSPTAGPAHFDDDDYPAFTMGRAAEMLGTTPGFLRSLDEAKLRWTANVLSRSVIFALSQSLWSQWSKWVPGLTIEGVVRSR